MQVFNQEFVNAVHAVLNTLEPGAYLTREQVCTKVGVSPVYMNAISIVMQGPEFQRYETVKSRGIRIKKESASQS